MGRESLATEHRPMGAAQVLEGVSLAIEIDRGVESGHVLIGHHDHVRCAAADGRPARLERKGPAFGVYQAESDACGSYLRCSFPCPVKGRPARGVLLAPGPWVTEPIAADSDDGNGRSPQYQSSGRVGLDGLCKLVEGLRHFGLAGGVAVGSSAGLGDADQLLARLAAHRQADDVNGIT